MNAKDNGWKVTFELLPHLDDLKLMHIADVTHDYPRHLHEELCIAAIHRGTEIHICRGKSYQAVAGDLLLLNAEEAHASRSIAVEYKSVQINPRSFARLLSDGITNNPPCFADPVVRDPELFQMFARLYSTLQSNCTPLEQEAELVTAVDTLGNRLGKKRVDCSTTAIEPLSVKKVRDYLRAHYSENVSLSQLAAIAGLSPFHLVRVFRYRIGVPPHEYQTQLRITRAQQMMRAGSSIAEAAMDSGFFDQSHLSRNFKRITGLTPRTYLRHSNIVQDN
jgi:AraC-like DNA-binding protein